MEREPELILEDATSIRDALRRLVRYASDATEALEARIEEEEDLDGRTEADELREALERDREAIKASWAAAVPGNLDRLTPEETTELYLKLRLEMRPTHWTVL